MNEHLEPLEKFCAALESGILDDLTGEELATALRRGIEDLRAKLQAAV